MKKEPYKNQHPYCLTTIESEIFYKTESQKETPKMAKDSLEEIIDDVCYGVLAMPENYADLVKEEHIFGKKVLKLDAITDKKLAKAYWKLDGNAFDDQPAPIFMKDDTLIFGGCPIVMLLPKEKVDKTLIAELEADDLGYVPIGFIDLHKIAEGKFTASGLGMAKPYHGKGLSKYLVYAGTKIAGVNELLIPTQLSNSQAHYSWLHLGPLEVVSADVFHNKNDTTLYKAKIPQPYENILKPVETIKSNDSFIIPFDKVKEKLKGKNAKVIGYLPGELVTEFCK